MCDSFLGEGKVGVKSGVQVRRRWMSAKPLPAIAHITAAPLPREGIENPLTNLPNIYTDTRWLCPHSQLLQTRQKQK